MNFVMNQRKASSTTTSTSNRFQFTFIATLTLLKRFCWRDFPTLDIRCHYLLTLLLLLNG